MRIKINFNKGLSKNIRESFKNIAKTDFKGCFITFIYFVCVASAFTYIFIIFNKIYKNTIKPNKNYVITLKDSTKNGIEESINVNVSVIKNREHSIAYGVNGVYHLSLPEYRSVEYIMFINRNVSVEPYENFKTLYNNYKYFDVCENNNSSFILHYNDEIILIKKLLENKTENINEINEICSNILTNISKEKGLSGDFNDKPNICTFPEFSPTDQIKIIKLPNIKIGKTYNKTIYFKDSSYVFK